MVVPVAVLYDVGCSGAAGLGGEEGGWGNDCRILCK